MSVPDMQEGSEWCLLQTSDLPDDSSCKAFARSDQQHIWHAWTDRGRYCQYHHLGSLKAPVARVVKRLRARERPLRSQQVTAEADVPSPAGAGPTHPSRPGTTRKEAAVRAN